MGGTGGTRRCGDRGGMGPGGPGGAQAEPGRATAGPGGARPRRGVPAPPYRLGSVRTSRGRSDGEAEPQAAPYGGRNIWGRPGLHPPARPEPGSQRPPAPPGAGRSPPHLSQLPGPAMKAAEPQPRARLPSGRHRTRPCRPALGASRRRSSPQAAACPAGRSPPPPARSPLARGPRPRLCGTGGASPGPGPRVRARGGRSAAAKDGARTAHA